MEAHFIGFNMWVQAVEQAGTTDSDAVRQALIGQEVKNLTGGTAVMNTNHHLSKPVLIGEVEPDGQFQVVWKTKGLVEGDAWSDYIKESAKLTCNWTYPWVCGNCEKPKYGQSKPAGPVSRRAAERSSDRADPEACLEVWRDLPAPLAHWPAPVRRRARIGRPAGRQAAAVPADFPAQVEALAQGSFQQKIDAVGALAAGGDERAEAVLTAMFEGRLYLRRDDGRVLIGREQGSVVLLTDPAQRRRARSGRQAANLDPVSVNNRLRGVLRGALGSLTLIKRRSRQAGRGRGRHVPRRAIRSNCRCLQQALATGNRCRRPCAYAAHASRGDPRRRRSSRGRADCRRRDARPLRRP